MARTKGKADNGMLQLILERKCCRRFSDRPVSDEQLGFILKAGQSGPSAKNRQPFEFIIIRNPECIKRVFEAAVAGRRRITNEPEPPQDKPLPSGNGNIAKKPEISDELPKHPDSFMLQAPMLILVVRVLDGSYAEFSWKELEIKEEQGVAMAAYSIMLAAQSMDLATCWICSLMYAKHELKSILKEYGVVWKEAWEPRVLIPIGYPLGEAKKPERKDIQDITHFVN